MRAVPDLVLPWVPDPSRWVSLGTDGFGRSDTRAALRRHFHVDAPSIVVATLRALESRGEAPAGTAARAAAAYSLDDVSSAEGTATEKDAAPVSG